jgi:hypothetical protein
MSNVVAASNVPVVFTSRAALWTARVITGLVTAFLLVDGAMKLFPPAFVIEATEKVGFAASVVRPLGVVLTASTLLHLIPRARLFGAVLLTAYLGGAVATHVRLGTPFWMPVLMGVLLWGAYYLRSPQLRALLGTRDR